MLCRWPVKTPVFVNCFPIYSFTDWGFVWFYFVFCFTLMGPETIWILIWEQTQHLLRVSNQSFHQHSRQGSGPDSQHVHTIWSAAITAFSCQPFVKRICWLLRYPWEGPIREFKRSTYVCKITCMYKIP